MAVPVTRTETAATPPVPPLELGDHLTRDEFERRWEAMPNLKKAELIEGVVYMAAAVRASFHGIPHAWGICWLGTYQASTPAVQVSDNCSVRLDLENEPQPDALLYIEPANGGNIELSDDDYIVGAPELVFEVAASSAAIDLHTKMRVYRRNGVREYIVWRVLDDAIDWFVLRGSNYELQTPDHAGYYRSEQFPGLWLDPAALIAGDMATVLRVLQKGVATPEHAAFVAKLKEARK